MRVGVAVVDVSPTQLPVLVNGGMVSQSASEIRSRVQARAFVIENATDRLALVIVDSCMMERGFLDEAKQLASNRTGINPNHIMISATHTHSAPSSMAALGTEADPSYVPLLRQRLAEAIQAAAENTRPAEIGFGRALASEYTALRRWVRRPDRLGNDPFGNPTVRANMHAARNPEDAIGPTGPEDPEMSLIAFRGLHDKLPIGLIANFSMHYFGDAAISSDYFGLFCDGFQKSVLESHPKAQNFVAAMSHGCSGDIWRRDYFMPIPTTDVTIAAYTEGLLQIAQKAYASVEYSGQSEISMQEERLAMRYRVPDAQRLEWAQRIVDQMAGKPPANEREVYAREQIILHQRQGTDIVLQAIRIGDVAIATTPNETYALTGMKLKLQSPFEKTMVIELANGGDGYIPPPEQHHLGGYNTWPARSAGLEVTAEPRIVASDLALLEKVCQKPRREFAQTHGAAAKSVLDLQPIAYWRMSEFSPPVAQDHSPHQHHATYEPGTLFFLEGDDRLPFTTHEVNRCVHFAGGRMRTIFPSLTQQYSVVLSFWNGMPDNARDVAGWFFSRDREFDMTPAGLHLGLSGSGAKCGQLLLQIGSQRFPLDTPKVARWSWHRVALVVSRDHVRIALDDHPEMRLECSSLQQSLPIPSMFFGGTSGNQDHWEGRLDEVAVFDRPLSEEEIRRLNIRQ